MSGVQLSSGAPPPLAPPPALLSSLSSDIQTHVKEYEAARSPAEKALALRKMQAASNKLSKLTTPLQQQFVELNLGPNVNVAVRIGLEMGLFDALPQNGDPVSLADLSIKTKAEPEFLLRIIRVLAAFDIVQQSYLGSDHNSSGAVYSQTPMSRFLVSPPGRAASKHLFDIMLHGQTGSAGQYYAKYGFKNPEDAKNCPFTFAHGAKDASFFDLLQTKPEHAALFNDAMTATAALGLKETVGSYPFDQLDANREGVVLVDVGGGKGHVINAIRDHFPNLKGKMVLEDLKIVLDGGTVVVEEQTLLQPYNFFDEVQPIHGANYFFKSIFHDWPDSACLKILQNLAPAMKGFARSRLLICDLVIPDQNPDKIKCLRDINMLLIGGKERTVTQWHTLLNQANYEIVKIYGLESPNSSIIEAVYNEA